MTKHEFEKQYCEGSNITQEEYDKDFITLPCHCSYEGCQGWTCVVNAPLNIKTHMKLYGAKYGDNNE